MPKPLLIARIYFHDCFQIILLLLICVFFVLYILFSHPHSKPSRERWGNTFESIGVFGQQNQTCTIRFPRPSLRPERAHTKYVQFGLLIILRFIISFFLANACLTKRSQTRTRYSFQLFFLCSFTYKEKQINRGQRKKKTQAKHTNGKKIQIY